VISKNEIILAFFFKKLFFSVTALWANNESSEVCSIMKPGRRVKLKGSQAVNVHKLLTIRYLRTGASTRINRFILVDAPVNGKCWQLLCQHFGHVCTRWTRFTGLEEFWKVMKSCSDRGDGDNRELATIIMESRDYYWVGLLWSTLIEDMAHVTWHYIFVFQNPIVITLDYESTQPMHCLFVSRVNSRPWGL